MPTQAMTDVAHTIIGMERAVADMAVLTFNYVCEETNQATSWWNCTEVYRRDAGTWPIVQTHWLFTEGGSPRA